ncbi:MAG: hypothetical protein II630_06590, partial [Bacteroidales bacterium]|nr:hypothetical protein [Bacteroidales bacterium]
LPQKLITSINREQNNGTFFCSLVIGNSANNQTIASFDENIIYNPYNEASRQEFYKKIHAMATRKVAKAKQLESATKTTRD